jgi:hypothetical protein
MSIPLILAINVGAASLLALILTALMLAPKRLRPHRHLHLEPDLETRPRAIPAQRRDPRAERSHAARRVVTGP